MKQWDLFKFSAWHNNISKAISFTSVNYILLIAHITISCLFVCLFVDIVYKSTVHNVQTAKIIHHIFYRVTNQGLFW
jgi:hypothetical protein